MYLKLPWAQVRMEVSMSGSHLKGGHVKTGWKLPTREAQVCPLEESWETTERTSIWLPKGMLSKIIGFFDRLTDSSSESRAWYWASDSMMIRFFRVRVRNGSLMQPGGWSGMNQRFIVWSLLVLLYVSFLAEQFKSLRLLYGHEKHFEAESFCDRLAGDEEIYLNKCGTPLGQLS